MAHQRDALLATTLARTVQTFASNKDGVSAGLDFEQAIYIDLLNAADWRQTAGPNEVDMSGLVRSQTGVQYEFDGALLASDALYIIEAKRHRHITRQHISEFVTKLLDITVGSSKEIGSLSIKPVFVSGLPNIDGAVWNYAVSWGVLLISPARPTPWELAALCSSVGLVGEAVRHILEDCRAAGEQLWRPFNAIVSPADVHHQTFNLKAPNIYGAQRTAEILEFWSECQHAVETLTSVHRTY